MSTPILRDRLANVQLQWLNDHLDMWYVENCCVWFDSNISGYPWIYIVKPLNIAGFPVEYWQITPTGLVQPSSLAAGDGYRGGSTSQSAQMYFGTYSYLGSRFFIYSNTEANQVDSVDTIGIPGVVPGGADADPFNYTYDENSLITLRSLQFNIFEKLADYEDFFTNPNALNSIYIGERSGNKYASEIVLANLNSSGQLEDTAVDNLARIVLGKFSTNWEKLFNTLTLEYDPLENYHRTEVNSESDSDVETPTNWKKTDTSLAADNIETESNAVYGFNSSDPVPDTENERTFAHKNDSEQSGTYTTTHNYGKKVETYGNIGVTTSQQMLESERNVLEWNFWEKVFNDLDSILTKNFIGGLN